MFMKFDSFRIIQILLISTFFLVTTCEKEVKKSRPAEDLICIKGSPFETDNIQPWLDYYDIPGICIAVIENDTIDWIKAYGVLNKIHYQPVNEETIFQAGSISKLVAATIVMHVSSRENLDLNEDINSYLEGWNIPPNDYTTYNPTSINGLLSHTGGINVGGFTGYSRHAILPEPIDILTGTGAANNSAIQVEYIPGSEYRYSGGGYQILQLMIEEKANTMYHSIVQEILFDTLNMYMSSYYRPVRSNNIASGHKEDGSVVPGYWNSYPELCAAGLWTNPNDLANFVIDIQKTNRNISQKVLSSELTSKMLSPKINIPDTEKNMGLGFVLCSDGQNEYFEHSGSNYGYTCYLLGYCNLPFGIIIMTNSANGNLLFQSIIDAIINEY